MNIPLSIVIPCKNDATNLAACLPLLTEFDDVQIVDSDSSDETVAVAAKWGRSVVQFRWNGKFPKKRNWALANLTFKHPWVLFLDADERMTAAWSEEAATFLASAEADKVDVLSCSYDNWFLGRMLRHGDVMQKTAVVRVGAAAYERIEEDHWSTLDMEIHEHLQPRRSGAVREIAARLEHHDRRAFDSHVTKHRAYADWEAGRYWQLIGDAQAWDALTDRQRMKYGHITKWWFAPAYFLACYVIKRGFLDGMAGFRFAAFKMWYFWIVRRAIRKNMVQ